MSPSQFRSRTILYLTCRALQGVLHTQHRYYLLAHRQHACSLALASARAAEPRRVLSRSSAGKHLYAWRQAPAVLLLCRCKYRVDRPGLAKGEPRSKAAPAQGSPAAGSTEDTSGRGVSSGRAASAPVSTLGSSLSSAAPRPVPGRGGQSTSSTARQRCSACAARHSLRLLPKACSGLLLWHSSCVPERANSVDARLQGAFQQSLGQRIVA